VRLFIPLKKVIFHKKNGDTPSFINPNFIKNNKIDTKRFIEAIKEAQKKKIID